jgi:exopolysaccharide production protein ExoZ
VAAATLGPEPARPPPFERALASFGDASYALYLIHPFVIRTLREIVLRGAAAALGPWPFVLAAVALALAASLVVHRLFEQPVTRWLRRRLRA